jgi:hypothetical protein
VGFEERGFTSRRVVQFVKLNGDGSGTAAVATGHRPEGPILERVSLAELQRETPREIPPALKPILTGPPAAARVPAEARRERLRLAHEENRIATTASAEATERCRRAQRELAASEGEMRMAEISLEASTHERVAAIRGNRDHVNGHDSSDFGARQRAGTRIAQAEAALRILQQEEATATAAERAARAELTSAAAGVVAALVEVQADLLKEWETAAARLRSQLHAALEYWPNPTGPIQVNPTTAQYLVQEPERVVPSVAGLTGRQAQVESRQRRPFKAFFEALILNSEAEFTE